MTSAERGEIHLPEVSIGRQLIAAVEQDAVVMHQNDANCLRHGTYLLDHPSPEQIGPIFFDRVIFKVHPSYGDNDNDPTEAYDEYYSLELRDDDAIWLDLVIQGDELIIRGSADDGWKYAEGEAEKRVAHTLKWLDQQRQQGLLRPDPETAAAWEKQAGFIDYTRDLATSMLETAGKNETTFMVFDMQYTSVTIKKSDEAVTLTLAGPWLTPAEGEFGKFWFRQCEEIDLPFENSTDAYLGYAAFTHKAHYIDGKLHTSEEITEMEWDEAARKTSDTLLKLYYRLQQIKPEHEELPDFDFDLIPIEM